MVTHIEDNIYSIFVPLPENPLRNLNAYLIRGEGRSLLIDTGFRRDECRAAICDGLEELGVSMARTDIFLTHLHSDHSGLAPELAGPDTRIFLSDADRALMTDASRLRGAEQFYLRAGFPPEELLQLPNAPSQKFVPAPYDDYVSIRDGDTLEYGGRRLRVVLTPGHTPGHACLYDPAAEVMFLGDHVLFDITPNITSWPGFDDALGHYVHSLMDISCYDVRLPLPAHRSITGSMPARIGEIIEHHGARVREMLDILDAQPGLSAYALSSRMRWRVRGDRPGWDGFPVTQKWFAVGETIAHLEYLLPRGRVRRELRDGVWRYFTK